MRAVRERLEATVSIASVVWRVTSRHEKPVGWATEVHPAYLCAGAPDVDVAVAYERRYPDLPWIAPNTVSDAAVISDERGRVQIRTAYYRASSDPGYARLVVRLTAGFQISGLMRTLVAWLLPRRGGVLLRALMLVEDGVASLVCGAGDEETDRLAAERGGAEVFDGFVAVVPREGRCVAFTTPFHDGIAPDRAVRAPVETIVLVRPGAGRPARLGVAAAVGALSSRLCLVDRRPAALGAVLETAARLVRAVPCVEVGALSDMEVPRRATARA